MRCKNKKAGTAIGPTLVRIVGFVFIVILLSVFVLLIIPALLDKKVSISFLQKKPVFLINDKVPFDYKYSSDSELTLLLIDFLGQEADLNDAAIYDLNLENQKITYFEFFSLDFEDIKDYERKRVLKASLTDHPTNNFVAKKCNEFFVSQGFDGNKIFCNSQERYSASVDALKHKMDDLGKDPNKYDLERYASVSLPNSKSPINQIIVFYNE